MKVNKTITLDLEVVEKTKNWNNMSGVINRLLKEELGLIPKQCENCEKLKNTIKVMQETILEDERQN